MSLVHTVIENARPYIWSRVVMVYQSIFHLDLFSFNPRLADHFSSPPSRFDSMTWSYILGSLKGLVGSSLLGRIGLSMPLMIQREIFVTLTFCLSELQRVP